MADRHAVMRDVEARPAAGLPPSDDQGWPVRLRGSLRSLFDLVFPPCCAGCGRADTEWCAVCQGALTALPITLTMRGLADDLPAAATALHTGILQSAIHALKYHHAPWLVPALTVRLDEALTTLGWPVEGLLSVPMHPRKEAERGYNQAALLAEALAQHRGLPHWPDALQRTRDTRSQVGLGALERTANVADAFTADAGRLAGRVLLLVDDVLTTGATLTACAGAARAAGAAAVYGLTLSVAQN